jgi:hypothetical protein
VALSERWARVGESPIIRRTAGDGNIVELHT